MKSHKIAVILAIVGYIIAFKLSDHIDSPLMSTVIYAIGFIMAAGSATYAVAKWPTKKIK